MANSAVSSADEMISHIKSLTFYKYKRKLNPFIKWFTCQQYNSTTARKQHVNDEHKLKILFFGTDHFSLPSLEKLDESRLTGNIRSLGVVTSFKNSPNCVRKYAEKHKITLYQWPVVPEICSTYDLGVVVSFGHLIPEDVIKSFPNGIINVHASLLPRWRGAAPIIHAIMNGDTSTGVSIMKIEPKFFDIGDILDQKSISIGPNTLMPDLHNRLANEGALLLFKVIKNFPSSFRNATKQTKADATYGQHLKSHPLLHT